jgi:molybdopterin converting factor small subunit
MRVAIRLFARYREVAGRERLDLDLPEGSTVETAWAAVSTRHPELAQYRAFTLFAVGHEYVPPGHELRMGDELCLFPPVSGGQAAEPIQASASRRVAPGAGGDRGRAVAAPDARRRLPVTGPHVPPAGRLRTRARVTSS